MFNIAVINVIFAHMIFIYIQTISLPKNKNIPYRVILKNTSNGEDRIFTFRPQVHISKAIFAEHNLERLKLLSALPFCDHADELIDLFEGKELVFANPVQFKYLKSEFKSIGYNFNIPVKFLFPSDKKENKDIISSMIKHTLPLHSSSESYGLAYVDMMVNYRNNSNIISAIASQPSHSREDLELSTYKTDPGVYFFLNADDNVLYVGKAKNIRKRLQSHFSQHSKVNGLDYNQVQTINVEYTGNDLLAQLIESANIKALQPPYNTQQVKDPAPYIINKGQTASGISRLKITRKDIKDNMPEKYFNRDSVKLALENFCTTHGLCRKHCGIETVKGPCSNYTMRHINCVCADKTLIPEYNKVFDRAFFDFQNRKSSKIYKLKGRHKHEDAFIYLVNDIYTGYGFIDKEESISNVNDILGHLNVQTNNYDTARITAALAKLIDPRDVMELDKE